jgi:hypothetical protein
MSAQASPENCDTWTASLRITTISTCFMMQCAALGCILRLFRTTLEKQTTIGLVIQCVCLAPLWALENSSVTYFLSCFLLPICQEGLVLSLLVSPRAFLEAGLAAVTTIFHSPVSVCIQLYQKAGRFHLIGGVSQHGHRYGVLSWA